MNVHQKPKTQKYRIVEPDYDSLLSLADVFGEEYGVPYKVGLDSKKTYMNWVCLLINAELWKKWLLYAAILGYETKLSMEVEV